MKKIISILIFTIVSLAVSAQEYNDKQNMEVIMQQDAYYPAGEMALYKHMFMNVKYSHLVVWYGGGEGERQWLKHTPNKVHITGPGLRHNTFINKAARDSRHRCKRRGNVTPQLEALVPL